MAHNLNVNANTGKAAFFSVKEKAWHNLGTILKENPKTSQDALKEAGLDYNVDLFPNMIQTPNGLIESGSFSTVRTDTFQILGNSLGNRYEIFQNTQAFDFFDSVIGENLALYETAGALGNGETIFITAKLPNYIKVGGNDVIEQYVILTHSHDGTGAIKAGFTPIRVVCNNTLNAALRGGLKNQISIRHTKNASAKLNEAAKVWNMINTLSPEIEAKFNQMAKVRITDQKVLDLIGQIFVGTQDKDGNYSTRITNIREEVLGYMYDHETQKDIKGTLYGFYNGITGYFQNVKTYMNDDTKFKNILGNGSDFGKVQSAMDICEKELLLV